MGKYIVEKGEVDGQECWMVILVELHEVICWCDKESNAISIRNCFENHS